MPLMMGFGAAFGFAAGAVAGAAAGCAAEVVAHPATKVADTDKAKAEADRMEWRRDTVLAFWLTNFVLSGNTKS